MWASYIDANVRKESNKTTKLAFLLNLFFINWMLDPGKSFQTVIKQFIIKATRKMLVFLIIKIKAYREHSLNFY